jgi:nucleoside-diphosphate-sugar epimerase
MKLLVLGATGFIGGAVYRLAQQTGINANGTSRERASGLLTFDNYDARELKDLIESIAPNVIVNAIGSGVTPGTSTREHMQQANVALTERLLALAHEPSGSNYRLVHLASSRGRTGVHRLDTYVETKDVATSLVLAAIADGVMGCSLEVFNTYGPAQSKGRLVDLVTQSAAEGLKLTLENPAQVRDFVHVDDVARAVIKAAESGNSPSESIEIGTGIGTSVEQLAKMAYQMAGAPLSLITTSKESSAGLAEVAEVKKAYELLGWRAEISLEMGCKQMIDLAKT